MPTKFRATALIALALWAMILPLPAVSQGISFGGLRADTTAPVEISSNRLTVDQVTGAAVFDGDVVIKQGDMLLSAALVRVEYGVDGDSRIQRLHASGGVTLVSGGEAAEARDAVYTIETGVIVLSGDVLLTQGLNILSGQKLTVDLVSGSGTMEGRVQTTLTPGGN
jgi:lipopolysaccharide export system protein LptA